MLCMNLDILKIGCKHILQYVKYINELTLLKEWLNFTTKSVCFGQKSKNTTKIKIIEANIKIFVIARKLAREPSP